MPGFAGFSLANEIENFIYRGVPISIGGSLWLRLLVAPSSRSGGGTETNYGNYARYQLARDATIFTAAPTNGRLTNGIVIEFASPSSAGNGDLNSFDIVDTPSGAFSKLYNGGPILPTKSISIGKPPKFRIGALVITF